MRGLSLWATGGPAARPHRAARPGPAIGRERRLDADDKPFDRLEAEQDDFHARVRAAFLALAAAEPDASSCSTRRAARETSPPTIRARVEPLLQPVIRAGRVGAAD